MALSLNDDVDEFRRLCRECWPLPEPPEASRRFDQLYGPIIDEWIELVAAGATELQRQWLRIVIRRQAMKYGKDHYKTAGAAISRVAAEVYLELRESGWRPG